MGQFEVNHLNIFITMELLAPAGNLEKMKVALRFGADAVYFGLPDFSLRARSNQFAKEDIIEAQKICQRENKQFYITMNIYAHNIHLPKITEQLKWLANNNIQADGMIISDPGIIRLVKKYLPKTDIHLSTQANATNIEAVKFWQEIGVTRVVLAREVTLSEIKEIHQAVPEMELEVFGHGAMCMSYSGRCILSKWTTGRSANLGDCAQPCRWQWQEKNKSQGGGEEKEKRVDLVDDKKRFGMRVEEDRHGTYMFNSYDLSLIEYLADLKKAGVVSLKIEGRAKSVYYVGVVVRAYRQVLNNLNDRAKLAIVIKTQKKELEKLSHRGYWTGFILGDEPSHLFDKAYLSVQWEFVGMAVEKNRVVNNENNDKLKVVDVFVHNKLAVGDKVEVIGVKDNVKTEVVKIVNEEGEEVQSAHGGLGQIFKIKFADKLGGLFLIRIKK